MTHYIPYFTTQRRQMFEAICGTFVTVDKHTNEPDCPVCRLLIEKHAEEDAQTAVALETEFPEFEGKLVNP